MRNRSARSIGFVALIATVLLRPGFLFGQMRPLDVYTEAVGGGYPRAWSLSGRALGYLGNFPRFSAYLSAGYELYSAADNRGSGYLSDHSHTYVGGGVAMLGRNWRLHAERRWRLLIQAQQDGAPELNKAEWRVSLTAGTAWYQLGRFDEVGQWILEPYGELVGVNKDSTSDNELIGSGHLRSGLRLLRLSDSVFADLLVEPFVSQSRLAISGDNRAEIRIGPRLSLVQPMWSSSLSVGAVRGCFVDAKRASEAGLDDCYLAPRILLVAGGVF